MSYSEIELNIIIEASGRTNILYAAPIKQRQPDDYINNLCAKCANGVQVVWGW